MPAFLRLPASPGQPTLQASAMSNPIHTPSRADGTQARQRLLDAALKLFSAKGYDKTSTREIAEKAGVNLGAISYYFGDKASLYRALINESFCDGATMATCGLPATAQARDCLPKPDKDELSNKEALTRFFFNFLQPLKQGELVQLVMRLHFRELVEPSGVLGDCNAEMKDLYSDLLALLCRQLDLRAADADAERLALAILGLSLNFFVTHDLMTYLAPTLLNSPADVDLLAARLAQFAIAMVDGEAQRRLNQKEAPKETAKETS